MDESLCASALRSVGWPEAEVTAICTALRIAGKTDDEIRALVVQLQERRIKALETLVSS